MRAAAGGGMLAPRPPPPAGARAEPEGRDDDMSTPVSPRPRPPVRRVAPARRALAGASRFLAGPRLALVAAVALTTALVPLAAPFASPTAAAAPAATAASEAAGRIDRYLRDRMETARIPGLAAVVVRGDEVVFTGAYGVADREAGRPMTADTPVAVGSTTKGMTALSVMQLVEQGLVDLDAPVQRYLPDFTMADPRAAAITLRQLLSMSAGIPGSYAVDGSQDPDALERRVATLATVALNRDPGSGYEYANDGFDVAGLVVQRVSGLPYERYVEERLFAPLGMEHSTFDPARGAALGLAQGYGHHRGVPVPLRTPLSRAFNPTGMALTSAADVGRYLRALLGGGALDGARVLAPASVAAMWTPAFRVSDTFGAGLGWEVRDLDGERAVTWTGSTVVSGSVFLVLPDQDLGVAVLANRDAATLNELAQDMVTIARGGEPPTRPAPVDWAQQPPVAPDRSAWDTYVGTYGSPQVAIRVTRDGDRLLGTVDGGDLAAAPEVLGPPEGRDLELVPTGPDTFVLLGNATMLDGSPAAFEAGPDGMPVLLLGGVPLGARR
jgi:CubicO group peptidase (beta-lactamase class C family)